MNEAQQEIKYIDILSPDDISINFNTVYTSDEALEEAFETWKKRFEKQGYYSSNSGRISLVDLKDCCRLVPVKISDEDLKDYMIL